MKTRKTPMRMCVGCREMKEKREMIRVVRSPEGDVSLDPVGKKPGRGAYVCRNAQCLTRAIRQKQLERQLEAPLGEETAAALQAELESLKAANSVRDVRDNISKETGVPASLLTASTEEDCKAQAEAIKAYAAPAYPEVKDGGEVKHTGTGSTREKFRDWFESNITH